MNDVTVNSTNLPDQRNDEILQQEINTLRDQIMPGANDNELALFGKFCQKTKLDPFSRQIYAISRKSKNFRGEWVEKWSYQTSIDGFRVVAERSNVYEGQTPAYWCGQDGKWVDVWLSNNLPAAAKIGVYRKGHRDPIWGVAKFSSYAQSGKNGLTAMWKKMPEVMIAKCAESLALRKAFPNDLSGLYTKEEMDQTEAIPEPTKVENHAPKQLPPTEVKITQEQIDELNDLASQAGKGDDYIRKIMDHWKIENKFNLSRQQYSAIKEKLLKTIQENTQIELKQEELARKTAQDLKDRNAINSPKGPNQVSFTIESIEGMDK